MKPFTVNPQVAEFLERQHLLMREQNALESQGRALALVHLRDIFEITPLLDEVRLRIEYEWGDKAGRPVRKHLAMLKVKLAEVNFAQLREPVWTPPAHGTMGRDDQPGCAQELEDLLVADLETHGVPDRIARMLDCGRDSVDISLTRRECQALRAAAAGNSTTAPELVRW